ncbi:MAG: hypothetical protein AABZ77_04645 [Chloroflexota bacterium]
MVLAALVSGHQNAARKAFYPELHAAEGANKIYKTGLMKQIVGKR